MDWKENLLSAHLILFSVKQSLGNKTIGNSDYSSHENSSNNLLGNIKGKTTFNYNHVKVASGRIKKYNWKKKSLKFSNTQNNCWRKGQKIFYSLKYHISYLRFKKRKETIYSVDGHIAKKIEEIPHSMNPTYISNWKDMVWDFQEKAPSADLNKLSMNSTQKKKLEPNPSGYHDLIFCI